MDTVVASQEISRVPQTIRAMVHLQNLGWQEIAMQFRRCWEKSPNKYRLLNIIRKRAERYSQGDLIGEVMLDDRFFRYGSCESILVELDMLYSDWIAEDTDGSDIARVEKYVAMFRRITREIMNDKEW